MNPISRGNLGESPLAVYPNGVLTLDGRQVIFMRVKLIARLCADIAQEFPMASHKILSDAGRELGHDYATDWILMHMPIARNRMVTLPSDIAQLGAQYEQLENQVDAGSMDPGLLQQEERISQEIRTRLAAWLKQQSDEQIQTMWRQLLELDIYGGWGNAQLTQFNRANPSARIEITASFLARPAHVWQKHNIHGRPVCDLLAGYLAGQAMVLFANDEIGCVESHCRLEGATACTFVISHAESLPK
ncbi:MAG TPA: 4-vinyl reductase [Ktedonobacterales bacterium]|jgi:hypothetical protein